MISLMNRPFAWLLGLLLTACSPTGEQVRVRSSGNDDWKFALSDSVQDYSSPDSDDSTWRILSLPHDWSIEGDFSLDNPSTPGGGALPGGVRLFMLISKGFTGIARFGSMVIRWDSARMVMYRFVMT